MVKEKAWTDAQVTRFEQLVRFRNDGASMEEADFQWHINHEPGFKAWLEDQHASQS